jgi:hypothetical protein
MNNYVNIPSQYMQPNADIDRVKLEALSCGASHLNLDLAKFAMEYANRIEVSESGDGLFDPLVQWSMRTAEPISEQPRMRASR